MAGERVVDLVHLRASHWAETRDVTTAAWKVLTTDGKRAAPMEPLKAQWRAWMRANKWAEQSDPPQAEWKAHCWVSCWDAKKAAWKGCKSVPRME